MMKRTILFILLMWLVILLGCTNGGASGSSGSGEVKVSSSIIKLLQEPSAGMEAPLPTVSQIRSEDEGEIEDVTQLIEEAELIVIANVGTTRSFLQDKQWYTDTTIKVVKVAKGKVRAGDQLKVMEKGAIVTQFQEYLYQEKSKKLKPGSLTSKATKDELNKKVQIVSSPYNVLSKNQKRILFLSLNDQSVYETIAKFKLLGESIVPDTIESEGGEEVVTLSPAKVNDLF